MVSVFSRCVVCGVWNGGGVCCCCPVLTDGATVPCSSQCSTRQYCGHVMLLFVAGCVVCGGVCVCGVRVMGYPLSTPPSQWWWVGALWMVGWHDEAGWHGE